jgi:dipeptidyl aminopeptidase/acylaminoacyl peptidase
MEILRYGDGPGQFVELTRPGTEGPHPCVVLLHGGFWRARHGLDLMRPLARAVGDAGVAGVNVEYRRVGQAGGGYPGTLADVAAALDRLTAVPGLDADRLVVVGHSAGGQLALWAAGRHRLPTGAVGAGAPGAAARPAAAVSLAGVCDLVAAARAGTGEGAVPDLLGGGPDDVPDRYRTASPFALVPLGVPTLLVHGDADDRVPVEQSRRYARAARAGGDAVELVELPGAGHREVVDPTGPAWQEVDRRLTTWTARPAPPSRPTRPARPAPHTGSP